jgi:hypothetical protein
MCVGFPGKVLQPKSGEDSLDIFIVHYIYDYHGPIHPLNIPPISNLNSSPFPFM